MKILIIEPEYDGHYMILYIKFLIRIFTKNKVELAILTSKKATNHKSFKSILSENSQINIEEMEYTKPKDSQTTSLIIYQIRYYRIIKNIFHKINKKYKFDHVFINSLDHFDKALSVFGSPFGKTNFSGILVNPKFHLREYNLGIAGRFNFFSKIFFKNLLKIKYLKNILTNDSFFINYVKNYKNSNKLHFLEEPREFSNSYSKTYARKYLKLPKNLFLILIYGQLKKTKGIFELTKTIKNNIQFNNIAIILAGKTDHEIEALIRNYITQNLIREKKFFVFSNFQDDKMESLLFSATDYVWVGYQKTFPFLSGVMYQAAMKKIPIIASNHGIIGFLNKKYKLGYSVNIDDEWSLIDVLKKVSSRWKYNYYVNKAKTFSNNSGPHFFMKKIEKIIIKNKL
jgi:hypothetical protein